jgi:PII-like signaling protein
MDNEVMVVRIYLREGDHGKHKTLMREIMDILRERHRVHGVTVFRGIAGFGASGEADASDLLRLSVDLPLVIEFFDSPAVVEKALALLGGLLPDGHIVCWRATRYTVRSPQSAPGGI